MEFLYKLIARVVILLKELINEIVWRSKNPKDLTIYCFIVSSIVFVITYTNPIAQGDNVLYFLSSISQGLAAIFSLIFAITIFGAQMAKNYTFFDEIVDKWTIWLMIIFSIGIILPLIQIIAKYNLQPFDKVANLSLSVDLFLATFCVLSIIPYSIRVNRIMKYEGGIANLIADASEAIDSDHKITASNSMSELIEIGKDSINNR
jgi:magnesium-transporting ATPase (P-type)